MKSLIKLTQINGDNRVSSAELSEHLGTTYKSTINLIRKHKTKLESLGKVPFKKAVGDRRNLAYLNEDQSYFLLTLSKNTAMVVQCKFDLVKAFSKIRKQAENRAKVTWQQNRELGKLTHRKETDVIKTFLIYAGNQGSKGYPKHGYSILASMVNSALGIEDRNEVDEDTLHLVSTADSIAENALNKGMNEGLPYKVIFQQAKANVNAFALMACPAEIED